MMQNNDKAKYFWQILIQNLDQTLKKIQKTISGVSFFFFFFSPLFDAKDF